MRDADIRRDDDVRSEFVDVFDDVLGISALVGACFDKRLTSSTDAVLPTIESLVERIPLIFDDFI